MKTKDLIFLGIVTYLAYIFLKRKSKSKEINDKTSNSSVGTIANGGLNLGTNMDLPNLTPTPVNGLPTEVALNNSNISPIIKDEIDTSQDIVDATPPVSYVSVSLINPNPVDVIEPTPTVISETLTSQPTEVFYNNPIIRPTPSISDSQDNQVNISETNSTPIFIKGSLIAEPVFLK